MVSTVNFKSMRRSTIFLLIGLAFIGSLWLLSWWMERERFLTPEQIITIINQRIEKDYLQTNGLILSDPNKTTSESQSYGLLMAVMEEDKEKFDLIWKWTKDNLRIRGDNLFAWRWENSQVIDKHSATDADQDIALALYYGAEVWGDESYREEAVKIIKDIWAKETKQTNGERYIAGGDWSQDDNEGVTINPSYFAPYAYKIFAKLDPEHDWNALVNSSYFLLNRCSQKPGLPSDWCRLDNQGNLVANLIINDKPAVLYSYDALRVPFRLALDYYLNKDERALTYLKANEIFPQEWENKGLIYTSYNPNGESPDNQESLAHYGSLLASYSLSDPKLAKEIFEEKIRTRNFESEGSFYDLAWVWFGLKVYDNNWPKI